MSRASRRSCEVCGGPIHADNETGICKSNPACRRERSHRWFRTHNATVSVMTARRRARKTNIPFNLGLHDFDVVPSECPCCGRSMIWGGDRDDSPTLDRIIPSRGYIAGNVQWLCGQCNRRKADTTGDELMQLAIFVQKAEATVRGEVLCPERRACAASAAVLSAGGQPGNLLLSPSATCVTPRSVPGTRCGTQTITSARSARESTTFKACR